MAELHVEPKRRAGGLLWLWILIALLIIAGVAWYLYTHRSAAGTTSSIETTLFHVAALSRAATTRFPA